MRQCEACFLTKYPDHCGAIRAEKPLGIGLRVRQKSARSRQGERAEEACLMLLPDLLFSFGGGHRFLCDEEGIEVHGEDADIDFEANLFARGVWARHDF